MAMSQQIGLQHFGVTEECWANNNNTSLDIPTIVHSPPPYFDPVDDSRGITFHSQQECICVDRPKTGF